ncbi:MAG TPA: hypothetical protein ENN80_15775 [Candidatus Hydrogenedentes bacterium]|nr:hypothetical protein [Candidatus Hydrogenedentota bacterium]
MKKTYIVGVREVHVRHYSVEAENEEDAKALVNQRAPGVVDLEFEEYSHELKPDTWSVEEQSEKIQKPAEEDAS